MTNKFDMMICRDRLSTGTDIFGIANTTDTLHVDTLYQVDTGRNIKT